jgi:hypothetical protein
MFMSRLKQFFGQRPSTIINASNATAEADGLYSLTIPDGAGVVVLKGTGTIKRLHTSARRGDRGSRVLFLYSSEGLVTLTNTAAAALPGEIDAGVVDIVLSATQCISLYLRSDGVWVRLTTIASN